MYAVCGCVGVCVCVCLCMCVCVVESAFLCVHVYFYKTLLTL